MLDAPQNAHHRCAQILNDARFFAPHHPDDLLDPDRKMYTVIAANVTGCRFYEGKPAINDPVRFVREPENHQDNSAIRAETLQGERIGYLTRAIANQLSGLIDRDLVEIHGFSGAIDRYNCPMVVVIHHIQGLESSKTVNYGYSTGVVDPSRPATRPTIKLTKADEHKEEDQADTTPSP